MDKVFKSDFHYQEHTGEITHALTQPEENKILARNAELRKSEGAIQDLGAQSEGGVFGRQVASIPMIIYEQAKRDGYDLDNPDSSIAEKEVFRFLNSDIGKTCLVREKI